MDLIEGVLDGLALRSTVFARMELSGEWGFAKDALQGAPFHIVLSGEAWVRAPASPAPVRLCPGDIVILPRGDAHDLMGAPTAPLTRFKAVLAAHGLTPWSPGTRMKSFTLRVGGGAGPATELISGVFGFGDRHENPLLAALPRLFHLRAADAESVTPDGPHAWLTSTVALLRSEVGSGRPGSGAVAARLADVLFIQAVRSHLTAGASKHAGWLRGIVDPQIGRALTLMHSQPDHSWSVETLARAVAMSRSRFAERFHEIVGQSPLDYLTQWRMYVAAGQLTDGRVGLAVLARKVGYTSEVAFSKAFKRWAGHSPAEFKRRARAGAADS